MRGEVALSKRKLTDVLFLFVSKYMNIKADKLSFASEG